MMHRMQVDKGAIRFVLGGANVMCPGFTSPGGSLPEQLGTDVPVVCSTFYNLLTEARQFTLRERNTLWLLD